MFQHRLAAETRPARSAEHLLEMAVLALVDDIEDEVGIVAFHAIDDGRQIGRAIKHRAVGLEQDQRRHLLRSHASSCQLPSIESFH